MCYTVLNNFFCMTILGFSGVLNINVKCLWDANNLCVKLPNLIYSVYLCLKNHMLSPTLCTKFIQTILLSLIRFLLKVIERNGFFMSAVPGVSTQSSLHYSRPFSPEYGGIVNLD